MQNITDFFRFIWPAQARYCVSIGANQNHFFDDITTASAFAEAHSREDVYHCVAGLRPGCGDRKDSSILANRCFYIDLDVKPGCYDSRDAALADFKRFQKAASLPDPNVIVASGGGVHVYWVLDTPLAKPDWQPVADGLRAAANAAGLHFDAPVVNTIGRILRTPGTTNNKQAGNPRPVIILSASETYLQLAQMQVIAAAPRRLTGNAASINSALSDMNYQPVSIREVLRQCGVMNEFFMRREPHMLGGRQTWMGVLGTINKTVEGSENLARHMSECHGTFKEGDFQKQWQSTVEKGAGPGLCASMAEGRPDIQAICQRCPHRGKIKSPILLGRSQPKIQPLITGSQPFQPPPRRFHYNGTGYCADKTDDDDGPVPIMRGRIANMELHYSRDGFAYLLFDYFENGHNHGRRVAVHFAKLLLTSDAYLVSLGIRTFSYKRAVDMFRSWMEDLQQQGVAIQDLQRPTYGWHEHGGKHEFVLGSTIYRADGTRLETLTPPDSAAAYRPRGSYQKWKDAVQAQVSLFTPALQVAVAAAFASPLIDLLHGHDARLINLTSQMSGVGKSTAANTGLSVMGDIRGSAIKPTSTLNYAMEHCSELKSLAAYWDEMRGVRDEQLRDTITLLATGENKGRLNSNAQIREGLYWRNMIVIASNRNLRDFVLQQEGSTVYGPAAARVFECLVDETSEPNSQVAALSDIAAEHCGWAGHDYISRLVPQRAAVQERLLEMVKIVGDNVMCHSDQINAGERFHRDTIAALLTGAQLASEWGILQFDVPAIADYLRTQLQRMRANMQIAEAGDHNKSEQAVDLLQDFLYAHSKATIAIRHDGRNTRVIKAPEMGAAPVVEYSLSNDEQLLLIQRGPFRKWIAKQGHTHLRSAHMLMTEQLRAVETQRAIGAYTQHCRPRCWVYALPLDQPVLADQTRSYKTIAGMDTKPQLSVVSPDD